MDRRDRQENSWYYPDMTTRPTPVPRFALFGEDSRKSHEELVHCETIEARSRRYDWEIAAHRHPALCQMLLATSGAVRIFLDGRWHEAEAPLLFVTPPGAVHGFVFKPDIDGHVLTLSSRFMQDFAPETEPERLMAMAAIHPLTRHVATRLATLADQIELSRDAGQDADHLRRALAEAFVRIAATDLSDSGAKHSDEMVSRFQSLVAAHGKQERALSFYAGQIGCTERTLNRRVRAALDISPIQYIHERLAAEATRLLRFTNGSCADVADELGFADPSYFSRFYLRMTGERPGAIRGSTSGE